MAADDLGPRGRLTQLLVASTMGVYLLIALGVTTALTNAVAACATWPLCRVDIAAGWSDPSLAVALGHRVAVLLVGIVLLVTVASAWRRAPAPRILGGVLVAAGLYPIQVAIGAVTAVSGAPLGLSALHLVTAMGLFSALLVALLWQLESGGPVEDVQAVDQPVSVTGAARIAGDPDPGRTSLRDYLSLTKPRLWWLLTLVALAAMGLAAGPDLEPQIAAATIVGGVLAIGASGTFNNVIERDRDRRMARTADRPLVRDRIPRRRAAAFGVVLAAGAVAVFLAFVNALAAALAVLAILFYAVVYTLVLKPHTDQNTVLGGTAGVFPALIGWAAVEDAIGVPALVLGAVVFLWTPAHFYNLALVYRDDYARAGFPMLPVVRGGAVTRRHITLYLGATMLAAVVLGTAARLDLIYAATAVGVGLVFLWAVVRQFDDPTDRRATRTFMASNAYLGLLLVAILLDSVAV